MKKRLFFLVFLLILFTTLLKAQDSIQNRKIIYKVRVIDYKAHFSMGYMASLNDSILFLSDSPRTFSFKNANNSGLYKFYYYKIRQVQIKRKGDFVRGAVLGSLAGLISAGIGYAVYEIYVPKITDQQSINYNRAGFISFAVPGVVIGGIVGAAVGLLMHKTYYISGGKEKFEKMKMDFSF